MIGTFITVLDCSLYSLPNCLCWLKVTSNWKPGNFKASSRDLKRFKDPSSVITTQIFTRRPRKGAWSGAAFLQIDTNYLSERALCSNNACYVCGTAFYYFLVNNVHWVFKEEVLRLALQSEHTFLQKPLLCFPNLIYKEKSIHKPWVTSIYIYI